MGATGYKFDYSEFINADYINVKIDDTLYENIPKVVFDDRQNDYGNPDYLTSSDPVPFLLSSTIDGDNRIYGVGNTQEISVTVSIPSKEEVTTTHCFDQARGYECTETRTVLTEESVTTERVEEGNQGQLTYSQQINADTIKVTFNGTQYECPMVDMGDNAYAYGGVGQGGPDFSQYPFVVISSAYGNEIYTETAGTYSVKIETVGSSVETSDCFKKAVRTALPSPLILDINDNDSTLDKTFGEIKDAYLSGRTVLLDPVNPTPILRDKSLKSYRLMTELDVDAEGGGKIVFSGNLSNTFQASSDDEYPVLKVGE